MLWLWLLGFGILGCFSVVILFGAPYLPTLKPQVEEALDMLNLKPGQTLLELGCGDGVVMLAAARRGLKVVGYELNPLLVIVAWLRTYRYHKDGQVRVVWANIWRVDWPPAEGIFTFLLQKYTNQLDTKITQYSHKPVKLVSFAFKIEDRQPVRNTEGLYLYKYN
jgi:SAM-dependent methyltransferase